MYHLDLLVALITICRAAMTLLLAVTKLPNKPWALLLAAVTAIAAAAAAAVSVLTNLVA